MSEITLQDIFDKAWQAFIVENKLPALMIHEDKGYVLCCYDDGNGNSCAVGLALPKDHPARKRTTSFASMVYAYPELFARSVTSYTWTILGYETLDNFQRDLHDGMVDYDTMNWSEEFQDVENRKNRYLEVAKEFNLKVPE